MDDKMQKELFRKKLEEQINKVPLRVQNGSIQATRDWVRQRDHASKLLKKPGATVTQLMTALDSIQ
jgi:hypothetical protein